MFPVPPEGLEPDVPETNIISAKKQKNRAENDCQARG
jgi:hypothetical protein